MDPIVRIQAHIGADGTLRIEGLHQIADQDVMVILAMKPETGAEAELYFDLEQYAVSVTDRVVADRLKAISQDCSSLPVLDDRPADEILSYNDLGLPE